MPLIDGEQEPVASCPPTLEDDKWYVIDTETNTVDRELGFDCYFDADAAGRDKYKAHIVMRGKYIKLEETHGR